MTLFSVDQRIGRRAFLSTTVAASAGLASAGCAPMLAEAAPRGRTVLPPLIDDIEHRTFAFFWDLANRENGLVPDRWPTPSFASIAAVGFALTAYTVGIDRGWVSRKAARDLTLTTLNFFDTAKQGPAMSGITGHKGFFYHFLDIKTGHRFRDTELSSVDSTLLFLGILHAVAYYDGADPIERQIRQIGARVVAKAEWPWFQPDGKAISMGWHPDKGFIERRWDGYNEGMMVYILALGSAGHPIADGGWSLWTAPYDRFWRGEGETRRLAFAPLFGHQYSQMWIDFRGIRDAPMRAAGLDYFENSRRATYANRTYCAANPMGWAGYSKDVWGLTACDGPANAMLRHDGHQAQYYGYAARGPIAEPDGLDDGTIAPTAALGSLAFAPEICVPAAEAMHRLHGARIYGKYGFLDSFNPSFTYTDVKSDSGTVDARSGWVAKDYLGIDQGAIIGAIANTRDGAIWRVMRKSDVIRRGLQRAGFTGGWLG